MNYRSNIGFSLILLGALKLIDSFNILFLQDQLIIGIVLIFYGIPTVYVSLTNGYRSQLFVASLLFFTGVVLGVSAIYDIANGLGFIFTSILFIFGGSSLILYIDNSKAKIFLYSGLLLIFLGYFSTSVLLNWGILNILESFLIKSGGYISFILLITGLIFFIRRDK